MTDELDGKVAIVTGTSRGVGLGIAHELLRAGATVIGCSRSPLDAIPGAGDEPEWARRSAQMVCDQGDYRAIDAMVTQVVETLRAGGHSGEQRRRYGACAARRGHSRRWSPASKARRASEDDFERTVLFHAFADPDEPDQPAVVCDPRVPADARQDGTGCIINVSSGAGPSSRVADTGVLRRGEVRPEPPDRSLAEEWGPRARVNCVALGPTITDNFRSFVLPKDDPTGSTYFSALPLKRGGEPAEVGRTCVFLASGAADFINGTTIEIDGGMLPGVLYEAGLKTITDLF